MKTLFSINKAADLLERDRATLVRALRGVEPDGAERGCQPRYTMKTITDALAGHEARKNGGSAAADRELEQKFAELDEQYSRVRNAPTLDERRVMARKFFSGVAAVESMMYADAKRDGEDPRLARLRAAEHTRLNVLTLRDALGWNSHEVWAEFLKAEFDGGSAR